jgi:replication factor A1
VKNSGSERERKNIVIVDDSNLAITASLWGKHAQMSLLEGELVALKGARVSDYNGKSLNVGDD